MTAIEPYPWFLNKHLEVKVNGRTVPTRITSTEWLEHWRPLLAKIYELHLQHPQRLLIAIGGPPGTGKSVLAAQLVWVIDKGFLTDCRAVALQLDGFHFPNVYLATHYRKTPDGHTVPLLEYKGAPDTFDAESLRRYLAQLRTVPAEMHWPGYSRISHDVEPALHRVHQSSNIVFVDGNYLLLDRGPFTGIPAFFDFKIYIETPGGAIMSNLMQRHITGGRTLESAKAWVKRIDLPNARIAESTRHNADLIIERNTEDDIIALRWKMVEC